MNQTQLTAVNALTSELHDDVADIGEEIIDKQPNMAIKLIDGLIAKLKHLKLNLRKDEV